MQLAKDISVRGKVFRVGTLVTVTRWDFELKGGTIDIDSQYSNHWVEEDEVEQKKIEKKKRVQSKA